MKKAEALEILASMDESAMETLKPRSQSVLKWWLGIDGPEKTLSAIGRDLGVSTSRAREIKEDAMRRLVLQRDAGILIESLRGREGAVLERPISTFELSTRLVNCLERGGISTVRGLVETSEPRLLLMKNFGRKSLKEVTSLLTSLGLSLGVSSPK